LLFLATLITPFVHAQATETDWNARLVGRPLYLRGFWHSDQLHFDKAGVLRSRSELEPVTLSGVEVKSATVNNGLLTIQAVRTALVQRADQQPGLERTPVSSTTHLEFSLRRGDKRNFYAPEEMKILVEPDTAGNFDVALAKIFVDGWDGLAAVVPSYWKCYAKSYFAQTIAADAEETVKRCVSSPKTEAATKSDRTSSQAMQAPVQIASAPVRSPGGAEGRGVHGVALIHLRVTKEGIPVGLQIIQALGAGADEAALQAVSAYRFQPAMLNGVAVPVDMIVSVSFH
jgi:TonB family protein